MKAIMNRINRIYDKFNKMNEYFIIGLMAAMCLVLLAQVISRYIFGKPLTCPRNWQDICLYGWLC